MGDEAPPGEATDVREPEPKVNAERAPPIEGVLGEYEESEGDEECSSASGIGEEMRPSPRPRRLDPEAISRSQCPLSSPRRRS